MGTCERATCAHTKIATCVCWAWPKTLAGLLFFCTWRRICAKVALSYEGHGLGGFQALSHLHPCTIYQAPKPDRGDAHMKHERALLVRIILGVSVCMYRLIPGLGCCMRARGGRSKCPDLYRQVG